jgi:hypothetical protein
MNRGRLLLAVALACLAAAGCHPFSGSKSQNPANGMRLFSHSPFSSKHDDLVRAVEKDPFPKANQPAKTLDTQVTCRQ